MTSRSMTMDAFANQGLPKPVTRFPQVGQINFAVVNRFKGLFEKPAAVLADMLGVSERTAKRKLGCERELSCDELGRMIRSEQGFEIVCAIMADASRIPDWWRICAPLMDAADIRKMQIAAQRRLTKALGGAVDADKALTAAIQRSEALAFHDEEHMRPHLDALRSMAGVSDRAVAPTKGRCR